MGQFAVNAECKCSSVSQSFIPLHLPALLCFPDGLVSFLSVISLAPC